MSERAKDPKKTQLPYKSLPFNPIALEDLEGIPPLHFLAKRVRAVLNAFLTVRDVKSLNIEEYEHFLSLFNSDIVFRLQVTREYALLLSLFSNPNTKARWAKFLDDICRAERREHQKLMYLYEADIQHKKPKLHAASPSSSTSSNESPFSWAHPDPFLSHAEKLQHYEAELHRITCDYHAQRASVHSNFILRYLEEETGYIDTLIKALDPQIREEREAISNLRTIKEDLFDRHEAILSRGLGSRMDLALHERQDRELHTLLHEYIGACLNDLDGTNPKINSLIEQHSGSLKAHKNEIRDIELTFSVQARPLLSYVKHHHFEDTKEQALDHLSSLIKSTGSISQGLDENQRTHVSNIVERLRNHCQLLLQAQDIPAVQAVFRDWSIDSAQLRHIVRAPLFNAIASHVMALDKIALEPYRERVEPGVQLASKKNEESSLSRKSQESQVLDVLGINLEEGRKLTNKYKGRSSGFFYESQGQNTSASEESVSQEGGDKLIPFLADLSEKIKETLDPGNAEYNQDYRVLELASDLKRLLDEIDEYKTYQKVPNDLKDCFSDALTELANISTEFCGLKEQYGALFLSQEPPSPQPCL